MLSIIVQIVPWVT